MRRSERSPPTARPQRRSRGSATGPRPPSAGTGSSARITRASRTPSPASSRRRCSTRSCRRRPGSWREAEAAKGGTLDGYRCGMPRLQAKTFDDATDVRELPKGHARLVTLDETTVGIATWEPGWRWSTHLRPLVGTTSCPVHHLGYAMSGWMRFEADDGQVLDVGPHSVYEVPAGHDAQVIGDEPFVTVEWTSARVIGVGSVAGPRVLATVLFSDIVDSTATLARVGDDAWHGILAEHNRRLRDAFNVYRGREVDTTGDGFLVVFDSASRAVQCGIAMSRAVREMGIAIRVGIHTGGVEVRSE